MRNQTLVLFMIGTLLFAGCSKENDEQNTEKSFSELIIGKWKLTKQEETINGVTHSTDYTNSSGETTHQYFEDGSLIFHEWSETFNIRYSITGKYLNHINTQNEFFTYTIISMNQSEMVLLLPDNSDTPRTRYYTKVE